MNNYKQNQDTRARIWSYACIPIIISGILDILVSLNILPYVNTSPSRIAIFNEPHTWQVFALGAMLIFFGFAGILPPRMKWIGRINNFFLLISFLAVVLGVILKKLQ